MKHALILTLIVACLFFPSCRSKKNQPNDTENATHTDAVMNTDPDPRPSPAPQRLTSHQYMSTLREGMTREEMISAAGKPHRQEIRHETAHPMASATWEQICDIYDAYDGKSIVVVYGLVILDPTVNNDIPAQSVIIYFYQIETPEEYRYQPYENLPNEQDFVPELIGETPLTAWDTVGKPHRIQADGKGAAFDWNTAQGTVFRIRFAIPDDAPQDISDVQRLFHYGYAYEIVNQTSGKVILTLENGQAPIDRETAIQIATQRFKEIIDQENIFTTYEFQDAYWNAENNTWVVQFHEGNPDFAYGYYWFAVSAVSGEIVNLGPGGYGGLQW